MEIWLLIPHLVRALQTPLMPWRGTAQQWNAALFLFLMLVVAGILFGVWQRHGLAGVAAWWRRRREAQRAYRQTTRGRALVRASVFFWVCVALGLVLYWNWWNGLLHVTRQTIAIGGLGGGVAGATAAGEYLSARRAGIMISAFILLAFVLSFVLWQATRP